MIFLETIDLSHEQDKKKKKTNYNLQRVISLLNYFKYAILQVFFIDYFTTIQYWSVVILIFNFTK